MNAIKKLAVLILGISLIPGIVFGDQSVTSPAMMTEMPANNPTEADAAALAKATQNPVADMISVPFQNNIGFSYGPHGYGKHQRVQNILNIQPVVPVHLNENWNLISRTILPVAEQPLPGHKDTEKWGLGDLNETLFLSPVKSGKVIWGFGPVFGFPTATDSDLLGSQKWSVGPSLVVLTMPGKWVIGGLVSQQWSYAGSDNRKSLNAGLLQPFINYNFGKGSAFSYSPIMTANWANHADGQCWTVPLGGGASQIIKVGKLPVKLGISGYYNAMHPNAAPDWVLQTNVTFLFPTAKRDNPDI